MDLLGVKTNKQTNQKKKKINHLRFKFYLRILCIGLKSRYLCVKKKSKGSKRKIRRCIFHTFRPFASTFLLISSSILIPLVSMLLTAVIYV